MVGQVSVVTLDEEPHLDKEFLTLARDAWPEFLLHAETHHWNSLYTTFAAFQVAVRAADGHVVAVGHAIPFDWDGTPENLPDGLDELMDRGVALRGSAQPASALSAVAAIVRRSHRGQGLSKLILRAMKRVAAQNRFLTLIAPVRPSSKCLYPLISIHQYSKWALPDGSPFDPWLRVHWRLGACMLRVAPEAMKVTGTVREWEQWTGMRFLQTGRYVIQGALEPVRIDLQRNRGVYFEPNIWMSHAVATEVDGRDCSAYGMQRI